MFASSTSLSLGSDRNPPPLIVVVMCAGPLHMAKRVNPEMGRGQGLTVEEQDMRVT